MKTKFVKVISLSFFFIFSLSFFSLMSQESPDYSIILGEWDVEVDADGEYYYLSLTLEKSNGELKGTISESQGTFEDVPLSEIEFDGGTLSFEFNAPTPPDGYERLVTAEFEVDDNTLEGFFTIEDLGMSAQATATRKDK